MAGDEHAQPPHSPKTRKPGRAAQAPTDAASSELDREVAQLRYEEALERLESIIERVEHGEIGLEETLEEYRRGRALLRRCQAILDAAEQEIRRLSVADVEAAGEGRGSKAANPDPEADPDAPF